jgi:nucleotide-binding universal stress UspA family protein
MNPSSGGKWKSVSSVGDWHGVGALTTVLSEAAVGGGMNVLLGIGGSDDSFRALEETVERAQATGDELSIVMLENPESDLDTGEIESRVFETLEAAEFTAEVRQVSGDPGSQLVDLAEREGFDQIVLGGGQRSPMGKIKLGHISEFVLLNSPVSVKLVR